MADRRLNERQLEVLGWIAQGCPEGVMHDFTYKTTAVALKNRHLVAISKRGGVWRAEINDAGRHYPGEWRVSGHAGTRRDGASGASTAGCRADEARPRATAERSTAHHPNADSALARVDEEVTLGLPCDASVAVSITRDADDWRNAGRLREYLEAMRDTVEAISNPEEAESAREWLAWASYVERLDPLKRKIRMPVDPEPTPKALEPFLERWSAYGPGRW